MAATAHANSSH